MSLPLWNTDEPDFAPRWSALTGKLGLEEGLTAGPAAREPAIKIVRRIIDDVRTRGDEALVDYAEQFDGCRLTPDRLRVPPEQIEEAVGRCPDELLAALRKAADRIRRFQEHILCPQPEPLREGGRTLRLRYRAVDSAGIYVPGGTASLASTVLMTALPAKVAGVERIVMVSPPRPDGGISDDRLAAAHVAGVDEIYRIGGAGAVAALAYGTESVEPVDFIAGPGNIYVTLAKKEVFGQVGIEALPGPSEVVIITDESVPPEWLAADLISQAEHNPGSAVLLTPSEETAQAAVAAVEEQLADLPRAHRTRRCLGDYGAALVTKSLEECVSLCNDLAPEHLQIMTEQPEEVLRDIRHAGAVFLGRWTPVPIGDYLAGPSHVLPTGSTARYASGLSANDFRKRTSLIQYGREALKEDAGPLSRLARAEGLEGHARTVELRTEQEA